MAKAKSKEKKDGLFKRMGDYFKGAYEELRRVSWPTRSQLMKQTWIVILICAVFAAVIGVLDLGFVRFFNLLTAKG